jgi:hypothetical protein
MTDAGRYTIAICKGSALLNETKTLLRAWQPSESMIQFRERVLREDLLGRMTAYRASDIVDRMFAWRFLRPDSRPALLLKRLLERGQAGHLFSDLCLLYASRNDDLLRGRMQKPWSEQVKIKVARGVLKAMADFGLMVEVSRTRRELVRFRPADRTIVYLAYELHFAGSTDAAVVDHRDWSLFGLTRAEVASALDRLSGEGWWLAQVAGSVVRVTWKFANMEEVVDAIAR